MTKYPEISTVELKEHIYKSDVSIIDVREVNAYDDKKKVTEAFNKNIKIQKGESIHTENSCKFNKVEIKHLGEIAELKLENIFYDSQKSFSLSYFLKSQN